jgi:CO dehydrogenase/acetyl-CoA synthase gamma subunit (corrinoid Fe-S protein)
MEPPDDRKTILLHRLRMFRLHGYTIDFNDDMTEEALLAIHNEIFAAHQKKQQEVKERMDLRFAILRGESTGQIDSDEAVRLVRSEHSSKDLQDFVDQRIGK